MAESKPHIYKSTESGVIINEKKSYIITKRFMDILLSLIGIFLLLPLFIIIGILIKVEDRKGSVIFKQERVGKNGEIFHIYKFRSMVSNAEEMLIDLLDKNEASGPLFKIKEDPRITKIGKLLRKTSIDELPQLINVLKGEMSLVGPRPALPREVNEYSMYENQRLSVLPGLTCFWQVEGRSNLGFKEQVELDIKYIQLRSFKTDIILIIKTVFVLFGSKDAY
ncbi:sugar transferase [Terribacillus saccharophilus]|uniref:sugar transferase n=1 Tax=Terribacillus saccharophilus TaxID=361277 RepID=UPI000BA67805|nr:sugar transferase [Terribacillus saccharophilus]PAF18682.1 multidrug MFS transporter [Terribacillus saccharophilus]